MSAEKTLSKRELLSLSFLKEKQAPKQSIFEHNTSLAEPPVFEKPFYLPGGLILAGALLRVPWQARVDRRLLLKAGLAGAGAMLLPKSTEAAEQYKIVEIPYDKSYGQQRSYPWLGLDRDLEGAGLNDSGPWDKYDELDRIINRERARSAYWRPTKDWLWEALNTDIQKDIKKMISQGYDEGVARKIALGWDGFCKDAVAASWFAPVDNGPFPRNILGVKFSEDDVMAIATMRWSGLATEKLYPKKNPAELAQRIYNGEPVVLNYSEAPDQDWWGIARGIRDNGNVVFVKSGVLGDYRLLTDERYITDFKAAGVVYEDSPEPGFEGNFQVVDRQVGGLILGTHQLAA